MEGGESGDLEEMSIMSAEEVVTTSSPLNESSGPFVCDNTEMNYFIHSSFAVSVIIIVAMSFMNRRVHLNTSCCGAKPGLAVPINLLDDFDNRWSYACAFGAITNTIVVIFLGPQYFGFEAPQVAKVFVGLVTALEVCIIYFPLFACIQTHHVTSGSLIGFIFSGTWLLASIRQLLKCTLDPIPEVLPYAGLVLSLPNIICLTGIAARFMFNFVKAILDKTPIRQEFKQNIAEVWHINYVRERINCREQMEKKKCEKVSEFIRKYFYEKNSHFKYSSRIICSLFVVICCTYQFGLIYMLSNAYFTLWATDQVNHFANVSGLPRNDTLMKNLYTSVTMLNVSFIVATGIALALFAVNIIFIVLKYRKDTMKLFRGRKEFIPSSIQKQDNSLTIRNCMLFAGFQIAYMIWGYFVLNFVLWVLAVLFCLLIVLPLMNGITDIVMFFVNFCIVPLVFSVSLRAIQTVISRRFFLQDKIEKDDKYKPLALDNRRAFHLVNYFFFMANIATGLFSCLYRILQGLVFGLIFLGRLDRCVLMAGLETQDIGYNAYLGMLYMEHTHNNPVLRVFCQLLLDKVRQKKALMKMDGETLKKLMAEETGGAELEVKAKDLILMEAGSADRCSEQGQDFIEMKERKGARLSEEMVTIETELDKSGLPKDFTEAVDGRAEQTEERVEIKKTLTMAEMEKMEEDVVVGTGETDKFVQIEESAPQEKGQERLSKSFHEDKGIGNDEIGLPESKEESNQQIAPKAKKRSVAEKERIARYRWHILLTLVNNPQLVGCRKQKPDKRPKKGKKKNVTKENLDTSLPTMYRYEQYRELKEEIRELEIQIFGSVIQKKLISIGCQPSEDFGFVSQTSEFSESLKRNTDGSSCHQRDSKRNSTNSKAEKIGPADNTQRSVSLNSPKENSHQKRPNSWSGLKTESLFTDLRIVNGSLKYKNARAASGPNLTTDTGMQRLAYSVSDDTIISQTSF